MPKRDNWVYRGLTISVDVTMTNLPYQAWPSDTHVIAAATLTECFRCIDLYLIRTSAEAAA